jgi:pilus assembly protein CpaE
MLLINRLRARKVWLCGWRTRQEGASTVEFSLFLPVIVCGCLTMGDIGLAVQQRMTLDQVVRAGAQVAMDDPGEEQVRTALELSASQNFSLESDEGNGQEQRQIVNDPVSVDVARYCSCPDDRAAAVSCSTPCFEMTVPFVFYRVSVAKNYDGIFIPEFSLARDLEVQIR